MATNVNVSVLRLQRQQGVSEDDEVEDKLSLVPVSTNEKGKSCCFMREDASYTDRKGLLI